MNAPELYAILFMSLTQEEWRLVFAFALMEKLAPFRGCYNLAQFATPGVEHPYRTWLEPFRRSIRFLALDIGYPFVRLEVDRSGQIRTLGPAERGNIAYLDLLQTGMLPNLETVFETALAVAEEHPKIDKEPLREALAQIQRDLARTHVSEADVAKMLTVRRAAVRVAMEVN